MRIRFLMKPLFFINLSFAFLCSFTLTMEDEVYSLMLLFIHSNVNKTNYIPNWGIFDCTVDMVLKRLSKRQTYENPIDANFYRLINDEVCDIRFAISSWKLGLLGSTGLLLCSGRATLSNSTFKNPLYGTSLPSLLQMKVPTVSL